MGKIFVEQSVAANYFKGIEYIGGKLQFLENEMVFTSHALNFQTGSISIPYNYVSHVEKRNTLFIVPNGISVFTLDGAKHKFVVWNRGEIISFIQSKKSVQHEQNSMLNN